MKKVTEGEKEAFLIFKNLGDDRSIEKVAKKLHKSKTTIGNWSIKGQWDKKIKDEHKSEDSFSDFESLLNEHKEMSIQISKSLETLIEVFTEKLSGSDNSLESMNIDDLVKLINNYIKSIPQVLEYIQSISIKPVKEKEIQNSFSICKLINMDETALNLSLEILSRISN
ncbi:MAG: hypothetical protein HZB41_08460 [Ignavibacteriae bacterium]|nr:hypothetical protein [Ignavibacteriota bacterium]